MRFHDGREGDFDRNEAGFLSGERGFRRFFAEKHPGNLLPGSVFLSERGISGRVSSGFCRKQSFRGTVLCANALSYDEKCLRYVDFYRT